MSKAEILAELTRLSAEDLAEVQAKLDEIVGDTWHPSADLSSEDQSALDIALADYQKNPQAGSTWDEVKARIQTKLRDERRKGHNPSRSRDRHHRCRDLLSTATTRTR